MKTASKLPPPPIAYRAIHAAVGPFLNILGLSCRTTFELCSDEMDRKLAAGESFRLKFHLISCGICQHLPAQFRGLRALVRACERDPVDERYSNDQLAPETKERIVVRLKRTPRSTS